VDHEICCVYHAHFRNSEDDERLAKIVHKPMSEYHEDIMRSLRIFVERVLPDVHDI
jgi:hypothetical protein